MNRLMNLPVRYPKSILALMAVITVLFAMQIPRVEVNNNPWDFLPKGTPERLFYDEMVELFDTKDMVMLTLVSEDGVFKRETLEKIDRLSTAIESMDIVDKVDESLLEEAIEKSEGQVKKILESVRDQGLGQASVGEISRALSLLKEGENQDQEVKRIVRDIMTDLEPVTEVTSLTSVDQIRGTSTGLVVGPLIEDTDLTDDELMEIKERVLADPLMRGLMVSTDATATAIMVKLSFSDTDALRAIRAYHQLMSIVESEQGPEELNLAGVPMAIALSGEYVHRDLSWLLPAVIIVIVIVLFISFGTILGVLLPLAVVLASVTWSVGTIALFGVPFSMVLSSMPIFLVAVGSAYGIHMMNGYYRSLLTSGSRREATLATMQELSHPVAMACLTTIVGFGSLATSSVVPIQYFGIFTALGVLCAMICTMLLIPAVLVLWGPSRLRPRRVKGMKGDNLLASALGALGRGVVRYRILIVVLFVIFVAAALVVSMKLQVGEDFMGNFREDSAIRVADKVMCEKLGGVGTLNIILTMPEGRTLKDAGLLGKVSELQERLGSLPGVGEIMSLADYVKIINKAMHEDDPAYYRIPAEVETETVQAWEDRDGVEVEVFREEEVNGNDQVAQYLMLYESAGGEELDSVTDYSYRTGQVMALLRTSSTISREKIIIATEKLIDEIFHNEKEVKLELTGMAIMDKAVVRHLVRGQIFSLMASLVICFVMIVIMYRSLRVGIVCFTPLLLAIMLNFAVIVLSDNTLNFGTALTASIAIGIGVDYSIHFVSRYRLLRAEGKEDEEAIVETMQTTGKAIIFNALSVSTGFMVLLFSSFIPVSSIGWLVALVMLSCSLGALTIIPAVLPLLLPRG